MIGPWPRLGDLLIKVTNSRHIKICAHIHICPGACLYTNRQGHARFASCIMQTELPGEQLCAGGCASRYIIQHSRIATMLGLLAQILTWDMKL